MTGQPDAWDRIAAARALDGAHYTGENSARDYVRAVHAILDGTVANPYDQTETKEDDRG